MTIQFSTAVRNAMLDSVETAVGASAKLRLLTGAMPATPATAQTGTQLIEIALPADWMAAASGGTKALAGTWQGTGAAAGSAGYYRIVDNAGTTCHEQGSVGVQVNLNTNALTAANSNVLNFAATTGVAVGHNISGAGIPAGATVLAFTGTTVTMSMASTAGVASGAAIAFTADLTLDNTSIGAGQTVTISAKTLTAPNP